MSHYWLYATALLRLILHCHLVISSSMCFSETMHFNKARCSLLVHDLKIFFGHVVSSLVALKIWFSIDENSSWFTFTGPIVVKMQWKCSIVFEMCQKRAGFAWIHGWLKINQAMTIKLRILFLTYWQIFEKKRYYPCNLTISAYTPP